MSMSTAALLKQLVRAVADVVSRNADCVLRLHGLSSARCNEHFFHHFNPPQTVRNPTNGGRTGLSCLTETGVLEQRFTCGVRHRRARTFVVTCGDRVRPSPPRRAGALMKADA